MVRRLRNRRGQSVVEYLVVAMAVILAIVGLAGLIQGRVTNLGNAAGAQVDAAAATVTSTVIPVIR